MIPAGSMAAAPPRACFFAGGCAVAGKRGVLGTLKRGCGKHAEEMDPREWRTSATEAGAFLLPLALADALPERISYTVGSELMRLNSFSLRSRRADGRTVSGKIRVVFSGDPEGVRK